MAAQEHEPRRTSRERAHHPEARLARHEMNTEQLAELDNARHQAEQDARRDAREAAKGHIEYQTAPAEKNTHPHHVTPDEREAGYKRTMHAIQKEMSGPARTFSKVIHNYVVEKTSDVTAETVARPMPIVAGSVVAFITVLSLYSLAKYYGFSLSGSETIAAFALGWLVGMLLDGLRVMLRR